MAKRSATMPALSAWACHPPAHADIGRSYGARVLQLAHHRTGMVMLAARPGFAIRCPEKARPVEAI